MQTHQREPGLYDRVHVIPHKANGAGRGAPPSTPPGGSSNQSDSPPAGDPPVPPRKMKGRVDIRQRRAIDRLLETIYFKNDDSSWSYAPGWDDKRVARETCGAELFVGAVQYVRVECYGPLRKDKPAAPEIERLLKLVMYLYAQLGVEIPDDLR